MIWWLCLCVLRECYVAVVFVHVGVCGDSVLVSIELLHHHSDKLTTQLHDIHSRHTAKTKDTYHYIRSVTTNASCVTTYSLLSTRDLRPLVSARSR